MTEVGTGRSIRGDVVGDTTRNSAARGQSAYPADHAIYRSDSPRVSACGTRYGNGCCTLIWIKVRNDEWVLLPHGVPELAVHIGADELTRMLNRLQDKL